MVALGRTENNESDVLDERMHDVRRKGVGFFWLGWSEMVVCGMLLAGGWTRRFGFVLMVR